MAGRHSVKLRFLRPGESVGAPEFAIIAPVAAAPTQEITKPSSARLNKFP